ncbi:hypothetical protein Tco_1145850 [Tanacetum coccineum]
MAMEMEAMIQEVEVEGRLAYWFEKIGIACRVSIASRTRLLRRSCQAESELVATCTLLGGALTWLNSHIRTVRHDAAYEMPWKTLIKMMTENYCPRNEIKKLEIKMLPEESERVEKYIGGLPDSIQGNVMSAKPKTLQEAIKLAKDLMDQSWLLSLC